MGLWRSVRVVLLILFVASTLGVAPAFGKGKEKGKKGKDDDGIELTGIEAFDDVFKRVGQIDRKLTTSEKQIRTGKNNLNTALGLKKGTPIEDGLAELKRLAGNKVEVAAGNGAVPKLAAKDAVPSNVQNALDAVNTMTANFSTAITELTELAPEIDKLVKDSKKMPSRLKDEFSKGGASIFEKLFQLPKASKALTKDIQITAGLPGRANNLTSSMTEVIDVVWSEFGGRAKPGGGGSKGGTGGNTGGSKGGTGGGSKGGNTGGKSGGAKGGGKGK